MQNNNNNNNNNLYLLRSRIFISKGSALHELLNYDRPLSSIRASFDRHHSWNYVAASQTHS